LIATYKTYAALQGTLDYTIHYEKGPWFRYLLDFLAIAPLVFIGAVTGLSAPASSDSTRQGRNLALIYFATGILLFGQLPIINVRLVLFLDVFLRLGATLAIAYLAAQFRGKWSISILYLTLGVLVAADAAQFYQIFVAASSIVQRHSCFCEQKVFTMCSRRTLKVKGPALGSSPIASQSSTCNSSRNGSPARPWTVLNRHAS
jgi:VanZ family protein